MNFKDVAKVLNQLEQEKILTFQSHSIRGWNTWFIVKKNLYNYLRSSESITKKKSNINISFFKTIEGLILFLYKIFKFSIFKRNSSLLVSFNGHRLDKINGYYYNPFIDPIIELEIEKKIIYLEYFANGRVNKLPNKFPCDINMDSKAYILKFFKIASPKIIKNKDNIEKFEKEVSNYLQENNVSIPKDLISKIIENFIYDYEFSKLLIKLLKPKNIYVVDGIPTGLVAAAKKSNISTYEFQHGIIGSNKFEYFINGNLKNVKTKMPLPTKIILFGKYFRNLILESGFWEPSEILAIGNSSIERARKQFSEIQKKEKSINILLATQPSVFNESLDIIKSIKDNLKSNVLIKIKPHPLEKDENINEFKRLTEHIPNMVVIGKNIPITSCLLEVDLLLGFHSTVLLESIAIGIPALTISTKHFQEGLNSYLENSEYKIPVYGSGSYTMNNIINDQNVIDDLKNSISDLQYYFYSNDYFKKIKNIKD